jgi:hypothetical protein
MSQEFLLSVPIKFAYRESEYWTWQLKKDGRLVSKNQRVWPSPLTLMHPREIDAWELRRRFLAVKNDSRAVLDFLNQTHWHGGRIRNVENFMQWQEVIREAVVGSHDSSKKLSGAFDLPTSTLFSDVDARIKWSHARPFGQIDAESSFTAIIDTIKLDKMMGLRYDVCKRPDCLAPYRVTSRHRRSYCGPYCAHLENVRRGRKQKSNKTKAKKRIGSAQ